MRFVRLTALALPLVLAACSIGDDDAGGVSFNTPDTVRAVQLGEGDVSVTSTDGTVILMLVGDTVRFQLSDSLRASVKAQVDSSVDKEAGAIGNLIGTSVGKIVGSAMGVVVRVPVQDVENVRYEDGRIQFESRGSTKIAMSGDGQRDKKGAQFSPEDGERFVAAVKARQQERNY